VGIVWVPESQIFNYVQQGSTDQYAQSARGAYQGFFDNNIQADFVHIDHISEYPLVYLPYPIHLKLETVRKLTAYVRNGGILVSEGLPAYFGERGKVGTVQPNAGLDQLFGARESYVEFTPDLLEDYSMTVRGKNVPARYFIQEYELAGGRGAGRHKNGHIGAVENTAGKGRTLLIGSFPGAGYFKHPTAQARAFFAGLLDWAGIARTLTVSEPLIKARLHRGAGGTILYVINPTREELPVTVELPEAVRSAQDAWQETAVRIDGRRLTLRVGDRNVAVLRLN
jgi:beta-galactosidase